MANGWGSRQRGRPGYNKITQLTPKLEDTTVESSTVVSNVPELVDAKPLSVMSEKEPNSSSETPISRL